MLVDWRIDLWTDWQRLTSTESRSSSSEVNWNSIILCITIILVPCGRQFILLVVPVWTLNVAKNNVDVRQRMNKILYVPIQTQQRATTQPSCCCCCCCSAVSFCTQAIRLWWLWLVGCLMTKWLVVQIPVHPSPSLSPLEGKNTKQNSPSETGSALYGSSQQPWE